eukprot:Skav230359  [mRNA]  locus=scaffold291:25897:33301:- [translate_table: standard]
MEVLASPPVQDFLGFISTFDSGERAVVFEIIRQQLYPDSQVRNLFRAASLDPARFPNQTLQLAREELTELESILQPEGPNYDLQANRYGTLPRWDPEILASTICGMGIDQQVETFLPSMVSGLGGPGVFQCTTTPLEEQKPMVRPKCISVQVFLMGRYQTRFSLPYDPEVTAGQIAVQAVQLLREKVECSIPHDSRAGVYITGTGAHLGWNIPLDQQCRPTEVLLELRIDHTGMHMPLSAFVEEIAKVVKSLKASEAAGADHARGRSRHRSRRRARSAPVRTEAFEEVEVEVENPAAPVTPPKAPPMKAPPVRKRSQPRSPQRDRKRKSRWDPEVASGSAAPSFRLTFTPPASFPPEHVAQVNRLLNSVQAQVPSTIGAYHFVIIRDDEDPALFTNNDVGRVLFEFALQSKLSLLSYGRVWTLQLQEVDCSDSTATVFLQVSKPKVHDPPKASGKQPGDPSAGRDPPRSRTPPPKHDKAGPKPVPKAGRPVFGGRSRDGGSGPKDELAPLCLLSSGQQPLCSGPILAPLPATSAAEPWRLEPVTPTAAAKIDDALLERIASQTDASVDSSNVAGPSPFHTQLDEGSISTQQGQDSDPETSTGEEDQNQEVPQAPQVTPARGDFHHFILQRPWKTVDEQVGNGPEVHSPDTTALERLELQGLHQCDQLLNALKASSVLDFLKAVQKLDTAQLGISGGTIAINERIKGRVQSLTKRSQRVYMLPTCCPCCFQELPNDQVPCCNCLPQEYYLPDPPSPTGPPECILVQTFQSNHNPMHFTGPFTVYFDLVDIPAHGFWYCKGLDSFTFWLIVDGAFAHHGFPGHPYTLVLSPCVAHAGGLPVFRCPEQGITTLVRRQLPQAPPRILELCAGIGGWHQAIHGCFRKVPPITSIEISGKPAQALAQTWGRKILSPTALFAEGHQDGVVLADLWDSSWWPTTLNMPFTHCFFSAPCPPWSSGGTKRGLDSSDGLLLIKIIILLKIFGIGQAAGENVPGLANHPHWPRVRKVCSSLAFEVQIATHDLARLGVMTRNRSFMLFNPLQDIEFFPAFDCHWDPRIHCVACPVDLQQDKVPMHAVDLLSQKKYLPANLKFEADLAGLRTPKEIIGLRVHSGPKLPTLVASYTRQTNLDLDHLTRRGLFTWLIPDNSVCGGRYLDCLEAVRALGFRLDLVLPSNLQEAMTCLGNSLPPVQALMMIRAVVDHDLCLPFAETNQLGLYWLHGQLPVSCLTKVYWSDHMAVGMLAPRPTHVMPLSGVTAICGGKVFPLLESARLGGSNSRASQLVPLGDPWTPIEIARVTHEDSLTLLIRVQPALLDFQQPSGTVRCPISPLASAHNLCQLFSSGGICADFIDVPLWTWAEQTHLTFQATPTQGLAMNEAIFILESTVKTCQCGHQTVRDALGRLFPDCDPSQALVTDSALLPVDLDSLVSPGHAFMACYCPLCGQLDGRLHRTDDCPRTRILRRTYPKLEAAWATLPSHTRAYGLWDELPSLRPWQAELDSRVPSFPSRSSDSAQTVLYTDGSCLHPKIPQCRVASFAVVQAMPDGTLGTVHSGPLPGSHQTPYRAELFAVVTAFSAYARPLVFSDCLGVVKRCRKLLHARRQGHSVLLPSANTDLWTMFLQQLDQVDMAHADIHWIPGHRQWQTCDGPARVHAWFNQWADKVAKQALQAHQTPLFQAHLRAWEERHPLVLNLARFQAAVAQLFVQEKTEAPPRAAIHIESIHQIGSPIYCSLPEIMPSSCHPRFMQHLAAWLCTRAWTPSAMVPGVGHLTDMSWLELFWGFLWDTRGYPPFLFQGEWVTVSDDPVHLFVLPCAHTLLRSFIKFLDSLLRVGVSTRGVKDCLRFLLSLYLAASSSALALPVGSIWNFLRSGPSVTFLLSVQRSRLCTCPLYSCLQWSGGSPYWSAISPVSRFDLRRTSSRVFLVLSVKKYSLAKAPWCPVACDTGLEWGDMLLEVRHREASDAGVQGLSGTL